VQLSETGQQESNTPSIEPGNGTFNLKRDGAEMKETMSVLKQDSESHSKGDETWTHGGLPPEDSIGSGTDQEPYVETSMLKNILNTECTTFGL
jgi:hypothetical protein